MTVIFICLFGNVNAINPTNKIIYTFPSDGASHILPEIDLIVRFEEIPSVDTDFQNLFRVRGNNSIYTGKIITLPNRNSFLFKSDLPFIIGDTVQVIINQSVLQTNISSFRFYITKTTTKLAVSEKMQKSAPSAKNTLKSKNTSVNPRIINGVAVPADFPTFTPSVIEESFSGYLFMQNWEGTPYIMIFKKDGTPYFYRHVEYRSRDFKVLPDGNLTRFVRLPSLHYEIMNPYYEAIKDVYAQNGYDIDEHELQQTKEGTYLMIVNDYPVIDMSELIENGRSGTTVIGNNIQEIDANNNVVFQWNCWDHFNVVDAVHENLITLRIDFMHMNSLDVDYDGNILASSRHQSECTKIDRITGEIIWRLGGVNNMFEFTNDEGFSYQHDFRPVPGKPGHYTIFDNGNYLHADYSRAVEFAIDTANLTATKVWEYIIPEGHTQWMGNVQRLPNGNTHINGGDEKLPKAMEVTPEGDLVYRGDWEKPINTYRSFQFDWQGMLLKPELILEAYSNQINLIFNKFGDSQVKGFNVYADGNQIPTQLIASTENNYCVITDELENQKEYNFLVKAYYADGSESESSNIENVFVNLKNPGENLIMNGDFSEDSEFWELNIAENAIAIGMVDNEKLYNFDISEGGDAFENIQLAQSNIPIMKNSDYIFEFDAMASSPRLVEIEVEKAESPWNSYSQIGFTYLEQTLQHFTYDFTMYHNTDFKARVVINCGSETDNVTIDNLSLREEGDFPDVQITHFTQNNPVVKTYFQETNLIFSYSQLLNAMVNYSLYNVEGKKIAEGSNFVPAKTMKSNINFADFPKGIYLLQVTYFNSNKPQFQTIKILYP